MRTRVPGVVETDDGRLATPNLVPGTRVYDEDLVRLGPDEYRSWDPRRSKLAAYLLKGGRAWPFDERSRVLYLGAANGTTPSHVSDVARHGLVYGVEFSPRSFRDLLVVSGPRANMVPVLADAWRPETYAPLVGDVDVLYMDIAQRNQAEIFAKNLHAFRPKAGFLMVKARSIDVARDPRDVFAETATKVEQLAPYRVAEIVDLAPFEKDHVALVVEPGQGPGVARPPPAARAREPPRGSSYGKPYRPHGRPKGGPGRPRDDRAPRGPPRESARRDDRRGGPRPPRKG